MAGLSLIVFIYFWWSNKKSNAMGEEGGARSALFWGNNKHKRRGARNARAKYLIVYLELFTFTLYFMSLGKLFHFSHTQILKKFILRSSQAAGIFTFCGSAACLVTTPSLFTFSKHVPWSTADFIHFRQVHLFPPLAETGHPQLLQPVLIVPGF